MTNSEAVYQAIQYYYAKGDLAMNNKLSNDISLYKKKIRKSDLILKFLINFYWILAALILAGIICYVAIRGIGQIDKEFLLTVKSTLNNTFGIAGYLVNTLYLIILTLIIAVPAGIGAAVYLNEYAKGGKIVKIIEFTTEVLSGIPSMIYGLFGMVFFGITLRLGFSILCGALTLAIMILPLIIRTTQEALKAVPDSYRLGAIGMGAGKWHVIRTILLPSSMKGIVTAVILAIGRIVGESAALIFTAGSGYLLPKLTEAGLFNHIFETGGSLVVGMYFNMAEGKIDNAFGMAFILVIVVLIINMLTEFISKRLSK